MLKSKSENDRRATLDKYGIVFIYDVEKYLETLEAVKKIEAKLFIPSHAEHAYDISHLAQYNIDKVLEIRDKILEICKKPLCFEEILQRLFTEYSLTMTAEQYALVGSTVRSYLAWLKNTERLSIMCKDKKLLWQSI